MAKKLIAMMMALCMLLGMASFAVADETEPFIVTACIASEPESIDPSLIKSVDGSTYTQHQFENLMKYQMNDKLASEDDSVRLTDIVLGQAESVDVSEDMMTYTFTLRDDIFWSDGQPVVAENWVYSWKRLVDPATASTYGYFLDNIVLNAAAIQAGEMDKDELGIVAIDDKTLQITLEAPCAYFLDVCAFASLVPLRQDIVEAGENWTDPSTIVVNGPYIITEWVHDSYIKMVPNAMYYDAANLGPDEIIWYLSDSETAILSAYQSGEYDFIESFPTDMIASLQESGDCFIDDYVSTYFLYINTKTVTDWRVRAAMNLVVDRENIVENVTQAGQMPAAGFVASGISDSQGQNFAFGGSELGAMCNWLQAQYPDYDLTTYSGKCELAAVLYQAAVDDGSWDPATTLTYCFNTSDTHKAIAEACASDWQTVLGMTITLENSEWQTYTTGLAEGKFDVARLGWTADYNDPITYLDLLVTGNAYNYGYYSDAAYDEMVLEAKGSVAGIDRDNLLYQAEEALYGEGGFPVISLYSYTNVYCLHDGVQNVGFTPFGYYFFQYATAE